jgi:DNA-directed RNA polymerase I subunit RPA1
MTVRDNDGSIVQFMYGEDGIDVMNTKYHDKFEFLEQNFNSLISQGKDIIKKVDDQSVIEYKHKTRKQAKALKKLNPEISNTEALHRSGDPIISKFHPLKYFGAISEKMSNGIDKYVKDQCIYRKLEGSKN